MIQVYIAKKDLWIIARMVHKKRYKKVLCQLPSVIHVGACINTPKTLKPTTSKDILDRSLHIPTSGKQSPYIL